MKRFQKKTQVHVSVRIRYVSKTDVKPVLNYGVSFSSEHLWSPGGTSILAHTGCAPDLGSPFLGKIPELG